MHRISKINPTCLLKTVVVMVWRMPRPRDISQVRSQAYVQHHYMLFAEKGRLYIRTSLRRQRVYSTREMCGLSIPPFGAISNAQKNWWNCLLIYHSLRKDFSAPRSCFTSTVYSAAFLYTVLDLLDIDTAERLSAMPHYIRSRLSLSFVRNVRWAQRRARRAREGTRRQGMPVRR